MLGLLFEGANDLPASLGTHLSPQTGQKAQDRIMPGTRLDVSVTLEHTDQFLSIPWFSL